MKIGKISNGYKFVFGAVILLAIPSTALACDPKPHAKKYVNQIHDIFGGERPSLVIEKGSSKKIVAFYDREEESIHIFKDDYKGSCEDNLSTLKVVVAHEYAHHLNSKIKKIVWIDGRENVADVAEHAISDAVWGNENVLFDDDLDPVYLSQYQKIFNYVKSKMVK